LIYIALCDEALNFINKIPIKYNNNIGTEINHIVSPLPSGVITAPKITIAINAYLKFFNQNFVPINPVKERIYIINGSWKASPNAIKNWSTKLTNSFMLKKDKIPKDWPY
jgi:hypothetical protein